MLKQQPSHYLIFCFSLILYGELGYNIQRYQTISLFACFFVLFAFYCWILARSTETTFWIGAAIVFRALLLFSVPALSDDFYRFIWDGRLLANGYHPFAAVPSYYMTHPHSIPGIEPALFNHLNSKNYYTVYPPVSQFIFLLSVKICADSVYGSIVVMKLILFAFEAGSIFLISKILLHFKLEAKRVLLYALNPLVIIELTGNLHFEGIMMFFLLLAVWCSLQRKKKFSPLFYGLSICTKLIPLIFLHVLVRICGWRRAAQFWVITAMVSALIFLPLWNMGIVAGFSTGLGYYFRKFEFNASIYYLVREAGYLFVNFNIIQIAGWVLALVATSIILAVSLYKVEREAEGIQPGVFETMLWCLVIFLFFSTTVHPWYVVSLIVICVFTHYRFPVVWSALIFLTYAGYSRQSFSENMRLIAFEYIVVTGYLLYEIYGRTNETTADHFLPQSKRWKGKNTFGSNGG
jgi:alpha-1,6-mannosyltransferase